MEKNAMNDSKRNKLLASALRTGFDAGWFTACKTLADWMRKREPDWSAKVDALSKTPPHIDAIPLDLTDRRA